MKDLGDIQWIFAKKGNISDLPTLKTKVIQALKTVDGKPIEELEKLFEEPSAFTRKISKWLKVDDISSEVFLQWLDKLENFEKIFEIVD